MSISDERLAHLLVHPSHINPRYELPGILTELQSLRAAAKVRAIREGDGEWDMLARAACRVAWLNFDAFGTESKSKRMQEMREAMIAAIPIPATGGEKE